MHRVQVKNKCDKRREIWSRRVQSSIKQSWLISLHKYIGYRYFFSHKIIDAHSATVWTRYRWISSASNSRVARCTFASCSLTSSRKQDSVYANGNQQSAEMKATIDKSFPFCILWKCKCFAESIFSYYYSLEALSFYFHGENSLRSNTESDLKYINLFIQIMKFIKIITFPFIGILYYNVININRFRSTSLYMNIEKEKGR